MEEILNILNDKYRKVERGGVDILLSIVLAFDPCDHRKSGRRVRRIFEYQPHLSFWNLLI
jgi:hypothetical protein